MNLAYILLLFLGMNTHDIQVAFFKIHQDTEQVNIDFVFEKEDLNFLLDKDEILSHEKLEDYISNNFSVTVDDQTSNLSFGDVKVESKHIHVHGFIPQTKHTIQSLEIKNTCLLDIEDHSNIIEVRLNNQERDFLMNEDRTTLIITY